MTPILPGLPSKPKEGQPCNGCGFCCARQVCGLGKIAFPGAEAPCPGMRSNGQLIACALVLAEIEHGLPPLVQQALGIGKGCDSEDT